MLPAKVNLNRLWKTLSGDHGATLALGAIVLALAFFRPGDAPWINDEPFCIRDALQANATPSTFFGFSLPFTPATHGLLGSRGATYGPAPIWVYQALTAITWDPIWLVRLHAALVALVLATSLGWTLRTLRASRWLAVLLMLSPWLWLYTRQLWDNTFCIPGTALAFAAYASFLQSGRRGALILAILASIFLPLVHLMSLPFVAALALHLFLFQRRQLLQFKWSVLLAIAAALVVSLPYANTIFGNYHPPLLKRAGWTGFLVPFFGPNHMTAAGLSAILGDNWTSAIGPFGASIVLIGDWISRAAFVVCWAGIVVAGIAVFGKQPPSSSDEKLKKELSIVALLTLLFGMILDSAERLNFIPIYVNGIWIIFPFLAWLVFDWLRQRHRKLIPLAIALVMVHAGCLAVVLCAMLASICHNHGAFTMYYGTVLSDQVNIVKAIRSADICSPVVLEVNQWRRYPQEVEVLLDLIPSPQGQLPVEHLTVRYRKAFPGDAAMVVDAHPVADP